MSEDSMNATHISDDFSSTEAVHKIEKENALIAIGFVCVLVSVPMMSNFFFGIYWRAAVQFCTLALSILMFLLTAKGLKSDKTDWLIIFTVGLACFIAPLSNGGFVDPRGILASVGFLSFSLCIVGFARAYLILFIAVVCYLLIIFLQVSGTLESIRVSDFRANQQIITFAVLAGIVLATFLIAQHQIALSQYLTKTAKDLEGALSEAQHAQRAESRFLANMSHEIRNPLNGLLGLIRQSKLEEDIEKVRQNLSAASKAGEHLHSIVDDILSIKRLSEDDYRASHEPIQLTQLLESWKSIHHAVAKENGLELRCLNLSGSHCDDLIADKRLLNHIVMNLMSNAMKFTPEGGTVSLELDYDCDQEQLVIRICDSGVGIDEEMIDRIFQRFTQVDSGSTKNYPGSGLGLAITARLVEIARGEIHVESTLGRGSSFTVRLPVERNMQRQGPSEAINLNEGEIAIENRQVDLTGKRVLCVDDSEINLLVISNELTKIGAHVTKAKSAEEAIALSSHNHFDVVMTDISMPEMDGTELQQYFAREYPNLPVIAVTGNVLKRDVDNYLSIGFLGVIGKPVNLDNLSVVLSELPPIHGAVMDSRSTGE